MTEPTNQTGAQVEILIVEDSPVEAEMLRRILVRAGYLVYAVAKNGEEALQTLREHPCTLVMSDINMPRMNGYELCHAIKYDDKLWGTPVILVTSLSEPKDFIKALDVGADGYITKPYVEDILLGRIRSLLANPVTRKLADERRKIQLEYGGEKHSVAVGSPQMANLMLSVYENSLVLNQELMHIQNQLNLLNESLEEKVRERTAALQESESKYRRLIENSPEIVYIFSTKRGCIYCSSQVTSILGYSVEHLYEHPLLWNESIHPEDRAVVAKVIEEFKTGSTFNIEYRIKNAHGDWRWFYDRSIGSREENGDFIIEGLAMDITERKQAENKLNEQVEELRRWHDATLGLGMRNIELKHEVNELLGQAGQPARYSSAEASAE